MTVPSYESTASAEVFDCVSVLGAVVLEAGCSKSLFLQIEKGAGTATVLLSPSTRSVAYV